MASSSRGSKLESDSCPDYLPQSEMERQSRVGDTRSSAGKQVHGATESDGCQPVRQMQPSTEQNRESKMQSGYTGNHPVGQFSWSHAQRTQWYGMENLSPGESMFIDGELLSALITRQILNERTTNAVTFHPSPEQRPFGSGTPANPMAYERQSSPEQRPFGSGTPANPMAYERQSSPEQRLFGSGTTANAVTFHPSPEQRPFGSGTPANPMAYERQSSPEQRPFGSGTYVDQMTFVRQSSPEQRLFGSGTTANAVTFHPSPEQRPFGSGTPANPMAYERQSSPEQRPFGSGTTANAVTFHPSPEQRPFGSGTPANPMAYERQSSPERRPFGSGTPPNPMAYETQSSPEQRPFGSGTTANAATFHPSPEQRPFGSGTPANPMAFHPSPEQKPFGSGTPANPMAYERQSLPEQRPFGNGTYVDQMTFVRQSSPEQRPFGSGTPANPMAYERQSSPEQRPFGSGTFVNQTTYERQASPVQRAFGSGTFSHPRTVAKQSLLEQRSFCNGPILSRSPPEQRTSSMSSAQLGDDDVMEDRDQQSDEEIRQNFIATSMETFSIEDNDDTLPDQATASVDPALFAQDEDGDTYLHMAIISECNDLAICLIHLAEDSEWLDLTNKLNQTPLHLATFRCQPKVIRRLLHGGAKRVVHDLQGNTPLHIACSNGHLDCVHELTSADPAVSVMTSDDLGFNQPNYEGLTCLHRAASKNHFDIIRYLVEDCGVNVNQKELRRGCTILHRAVATSNLTLLDYLLSLPASAELIIDEPTYDGYTALHLARLTKQTHVEQMLLSAGAHQVTYWPTPEAEV